MPRRFWEYVSRSTLKREFASLAFFLWLGYGFRLMERVPASQLAPDAALQIWATLTPFMFTLVMAVFTQDWLSKQTNIAGPPSSTETTVKTEVTDTTATVTTTSEPKP